MKYKKESAFNKLKALANSNTGRKETTVTYSNPENCSTSMPKPEKEIILLQALDILGMKWLARDDDGYLCSYSAKPDRRVTTFRGKTEITWWAQPKAMQCDCEGFLEAYFDEITAADEEPTNIRELLSKKCSEKIGDSLSEGNTVEDILKR